MNFPGSDWRLLLAAGVVTLAAGGIVAWWRLRPRDPQEIERRRRAYLNQIGRIVEGQILEITEAAAPVRPARRRIFRRQRPNPLPAGNGARKLVVYSYTISGVSYETAQDVTGLEERACLDRVIAGQPASVKYDPANPSNSILVADDWSGLH